MYNILQLKDIQDNSYELFIIVAFNALMKTEQYHNIGKVKIAITLEKDVNDCANAITFDDVKNYKYIL